MTAAFLLHRYDWSESSAILDLFTREQGRVVVVAKGAKRPYSQLRSVLMPFQRLNVHYGRRRSRGGADDQAGEVQPLKTAEWAGGPAPAGGAALMTGFYLNELLMKLLARHDPHPTLFDAYALTLPALGSGDDAYVGAALRAFELLLLREIGLLPALDRVTLTQQPLAAAESRYALRPEVGMTGVAVVEGGLTAASWHALQAALDADDLAALQRLCVAVHGELRPWLRTLLHYHLEVSILRTRQVMLDLQSLEPGRSR
jgi:DNA repair protein RecO (recombination protein O)